MDLITSSVQPTTWDSVGGTGSITLFPPTLDLVVNTTDDVHEEIDTLFERLRKLPPMADAPRGGRPARPHSLVYENGWDFDSMIEMITSVLDPTTWDSVGGTGSIAKNEPRAAC